MTALLDALEVWDEIRIQDNLFNFSVSVYHLVDWVKEYYPNLKDAVYDWLNTHEELRAFRDLANASKHVSLTVDKGPYENYPPVVEDVEASATSFDVAMLTGPPYRLKVQLENGARLTINELADKAIQAWDEFFNVNKRELST